MTDELEALVERWRRAFGEAPARLDARLMRQILDAHESGDTPG